MSQEVNLAAVTYCLLLGKKVKLAYARSASWLLRMPYVMMLPPQGQNAGQSYDGCFSDPATHITPAHRDGNETASNVLAQLASRVCQNLQSHGPKTLLELLRRSNA